MAWICDREMNDRSIMLLSQGCILAQVLRWRLDWVCKVQSERRVKVRY